jgi:hypothetical protein
MDDETDAQAAWRLQEERAAGRQVPVTCEQPALLQYRDICLLGQHLDRLYRVFDSPRVHCVVFEDLILDARRTYEHVLAFLGVASDHRRDFPRVNPATAHRSRLLAKALGRARLAFNDLPFQSIVRPALNTLAPLKDSLRRLNTVERQKATLSEDFVRELRHVFAEDVQHLERLLERDLSLWLKE